MTAPILTLRQRAVLYFIRGFLQDYGYVCTTREIMHGLGYADTSAVNYQLGELAKAGMLTRQKGAARTIVLVEEGEL